MSYKRSRYSPLYEGIENGLGRLYFVSTWLYPLSVFCTTPTSWDIMGAGDTQPRLLISSCVWSSKIGWIVCILCLYLTVLTYNRLYFHPLTIHLTMDCAYCHHHPRANTVSRIFGKLHYTRTNVNAHKNNVGMRARLCWFSLSCIRMNFEWICVRRQWRDTRRKRISDRLW